MLGSPWSADLYNRFRAQRSAPFFDLLELIEREPEMRVLDLGCGTGELTRVLHDSLRAAETRGLDASETMLAHSVRFATPGLHFVQGRIEAPLDQGPYELIFSHAALHWVEDHPSLFGRLAQAVAQGGQLAAQLPANFDHPTHTLALEVAQEPPFVAALDGFQREVPVLSPEAYSRLLHAHGFVRQRVRLEVYAHVLEQPADLVEWVKGTLLTDYQARLSPELYATFLARYQTRILETFGDTGPVLYPFKRLLVWGRKPVRGVA